MTNETPKCEKTPVAKPTQATLVDALQLLKSPSTRTRGDQRKTYALMASPSTRTRSHAKLDVEPILFESWGAVKGKRVRNETQGKKTALNMAVNSIASPMAEPNEVITNGATSCSKAKGGPNASKLKMGSCFLIAKGGPSRPKAMRRDAHWGRRWRSI